MSLDEGMGAAVVVGTCFGGLTDAGLMPEEVGMVEGEELVEETLDELMFGLKLVEDEVVAVRLEPEGQLVVTTAGVSFTG